MALAIGLFRNILPFPYQYVLNPCYVAMAEGGNERPQIAGSRAPGNRPLTILALIVNVGG